ncbi:unnamed protein product [Lactuca saligna]|uniref:Uncharacterized protein n=1 Tax=Lactuca saligna TaxID=75948 RepID=A0AA35VNA2_LACSI|nr:unnamed protein product [Lactuca saligna]
MVIDTEEEYELEHMKDLEEESNQSLKPYRPLLPFPSRANENLVKQENTKFLKHDEFECMKEEEWEEWEEPLLKEQLEKEVNYSKPPVSTPMMFEVFDFTRPPNLVIEVIEEQDVESDESHFDKKNPKRNKTKSKYTRMRKEPKQKHKEDVNSTMQESSIKEFNRRVAYK